MLFHVPLLNFAIPATQDMRLALRFDSLPISKVRTAEDTHVTHDLYPAPVSSNQLGFCLTRSRNAR